MAPKRLVLRRNLSDPPPPPKPLHMREPDAVYGDLAGGQRFVVKGTSTVWTKARPGSKWAFWGNDPGNRSCFRPFGNQDPVIKVE